MALELNDMVNIDTPAACPGELKVHGIRPSTKGLHGRVTAINEGEPWHQEYPDHFYLVALSNGHHGWFAASELEKRSAG